MLLNIMVFDNVWIQKEIKIFWIKLQKKEKFEKKIKFILIVGGTGFLGSNIARSLLNKKIEFLAFQLNHRKRKKT